MYTISELIGKEAIILSDGTSAGTVANICFDTRLKTFKYVLLIFDEHEDRKIAPFRAISAFKDDAIVIKSSESVVDIKEGGDNLMFCPINLPAFNQDGKALGTIRDVLMEDSRTKEFVTDLISIDAETLLTASDKLLIFNDTGEKIKKPPVKKKPVAAVAPPSARPYSRSRSCPVCAQCKPVNDERALRHAEKERRNSALRTASNAEKDNSLISKAATPPAQAKHVVLQTTQEGEQRAAAYSPQNRTYDNISVQNEPSVKSVSILQKAEKTMPEQEPRKDTARISESPVPAKNRAPQTMQRSDVAGMPVLQKNALQDDAVSKNTLHSRHNRPAPKTPPVCTASSDLSKPVSSALSDGAAGSVDLNTDAVSQQNKSPIIGTTRAISYAEDLLGLLQGKLRQVETPSKIPLDNTDVRRSPVLKEDKIKYSFLLGKRLERDIYTNDGKLLLAKDELITDATVQKAKAHDKLVLLALHSL